MKISQLLIDYVNKNKRERTLGRYWASEISSIIGGYLLPEDFFTHRQIDLKGVKNILTGLATEDKLTQIFKEMKVPVEFQAKKEITITEEINLVVKPDYVFEDFLIETKFPFSDFNLKDIPERYAYQLECEYRAFEKQVYLGMFSIPFNLQLIPFSPSKKRWEEIQIALKDFHNKLKEISN